MKTSELKDAPLDWAVAKCELVAGTMTENAQDWKSGLPLYQHGHLFGAGILQKGTLNQATGEPWVFHGPGCAFSPSTNWSQGGPIIDREIRNGLHFWQEGSGQFAATYNYGGDDFYTYGPTPLAAAMRCYVASKLGDEVEVPTGLL